MSNPTVDELVGDYLARLEEAARDLPAGRRTELLDEIREHIDAGRETGAAADEAAVRTMLDRLGEPEDIAAAALAEDAGWQPAAAGAPPAPAGVRAATEPAVVPPAPDVPTAGRAEPAARSPWGGSEVVSVILLAASTVFAIALFGPAGVVLALLALIAGLVFVWSSPQWTQREKRIATVVAAVPPAVALLGVVAFTMMWRVM